MSVPFLLAALAVLPSDRLMMADRLFNRGRFAEAAAEYRALTSEKDLAADQMLFRLAECQRALNNSAEAARLYGELALKYPDSKYAPQSRLQHALATTGPDRARLLAALDTDRVDAKVRAAALYHLGVEKNDPSLFERCVKTDPKGRYALYADLRRGSLLNASQNAKDRRKGVEILLGIAFSGGQLSEEALYLAAAQSYRDRKYEDAGTLLRRYRKSYPAGKHIDDARVMSVWCDFMTGRYADAATACGEGKTDDFAYLKAACAQASGDDAKAAELFRKYLDDFPQGRYRKDVALPLARLEFERATTGTDTAKILEAAKRAADLSKQAQDALRLAWAYEKSGRSDLALAEYERVQREHPGTDHAAEAAYAAAMLHARAERWAKAELAFAEALASEKLGKRRATALYWRGVAALRIDHPREGVGFLREAEKLGLGLDESREARLMIADQDLREGRAEEARKAYATLVREGAVARMSPARLNEVAKLLEGTDEARQCAEKLSRNASPHWRARGHSLLGRRLEGEGSFKAAIEAYRRSLAESVEDTREAAEVMLRLGRLETRNAEYEAAQATLAKAVRASSAFPRIRGEAYLAMAKNCEARKDVGGARKYASVLTALFDDKELCAEAQRILDAHPEEGE